MKKLSYYTKRIKRATMLVASAIIFISLQGCQEELIKPNTGHTKPAKVTVPDLKF